MSIASRGSLSQLSLWFLGVDHSLFVAFSPSSGNRLGKSSDGGVHHSIFASSHVAASASELLRGSLTSCVASSSEVILIALLIRRSHSSRDIERSGLSTFSVERISLKLPSFHLSRVCRLLSGLVAWLVGDRSTSKPFPVIEDSLLLSSFSVVDGGIETLLVLGSKSAARIPLFVDVVVISVPDKVSSWDF